MRTGVTLTKLLLSLIVAGFMTFERASAQSSAGGGSIQGTVTDDSGAAVPNANIKINHIATGRQIDTATNGAGFYSTPTVNIGQYESGQVVRRERFQAAADATLAAARLVK
jgi:uncharacterized protein YjdB